MNIIIIEDEFRAAKSLQNLISEVKPEAKITGVYDSIEMSIEALSKAANLILFLWIFIYQTGFEIFKQVEITCPVVFCTAFDQYMLDAFKSKGVDYVLKPFSRDDIAEAFRKVDELKSFFRRPNFRNSKLFLQKITQPQPAAKSSFLVFKNQKYTTVPTDNIAYFFIHNEITHLMTFDKQQFQLSQTLGQIAEQVSQQQFFRVNRQYIINFSAIKEMEHYFQRKILVKLTVETPEQLFINKEKSHSFFTWLEDR
jgi:DNA-binding LytR/AlgR family response regulator